MMTLSRLMVFALLILCEACAALPKPTVTHLDRGLIWMIPGIHGTPSMLAEACRGLEDAGVRSAIEVYDWQRGELFGALANLLDLERNLGRAAELAKSITQ